MQQAHSSLRQLASGISMVADRRRLAGIISTCGACDWIACTDDGIDLYRKTIHAMTCVRIEMIYYGVWL